MIRKAEEKDLSRIAEILVFDKRLKYRDIFHDDLYSFNRLQVLSVVKEYGERGFLDHIWVYDDGVVKGLIHIEEKEIVELYVDSFFQRQGIGEKLIEFAMEEHQVEYLWVIEKNGDAIHFYEAEGFHITDERKLEEGTSEYLVCMHR